MISFTYRKLLTGAYAGNLYIESDVEKINGVHAIGHTIFFGKENALAESLYIYFGVGYRHFGKVDLQGWNQRCSRIAATTDLANQADTYITSADPATLSILNQSADVTWYGNLNGKASLSYASASGKRFTYNGRSGTSTGSITVNSGYFRFETNAVHKGLSKLVAKGTGTFEFPASTSGGTVSIASINPSGVSVAFEDSGKIDVASGAVLEVNTATVDDEYVEPGLYTKNDGTEVGEHLTGNGALRVLNNAPVTAGDTYVWTGAAGDGLLTTDGNWEGGAAPDLTEGTAKLFFSAGTASATVIGTAYVYGITFCTNAAFTLTLTGADANAKVVVGAGGTLAVAPGAGAKAFGPAQDTSAALLTVVATNAPTLSVAAGERAAVDMLAVVEAGGKVTWKDPGVYGGPDAGLPASRTVDWISGTGTLRVRHGISGGTMLTIR